MPRIKKAALLYNVAPGGGGGMIVCQAVEGLSHLVPVPLPQRVRCVEDVQSTWQCKQGVIILPDRSCPLALPHQ